MVLIFWFRNMAKWDYFFIFSSRYRGIESVYSFRTYDRKKKTILNLFMPNIYSFLRLIQLLFTTPATMATVECFALIRMMIFTKSTKSHERLARLPPIFAETELFENWGIIQNVYMQKKKKNEKFCWQTRQTYFIVK